ncbi:hypothetical protein VTK73DRAFT_8050 [Phialemonium thermophilum]|uniref:Protein kinase domain-containing protein n=1 Tax=Phialemonium thermophilum TaxID=223376 RepID=A0ABR3WB00_9PEZI
MGPIYTVKFINEEASSIHGNLKVASIYTSESGEWKLGGFEVLSSVKDDDAVIYTYGSLVPDSARYTPPELAKSGWDAIKKGPHSAVDSFDYGILLFEVFNGNYIGPEQAGQTKGIPPSMHASYKRLVNPNPKARLSIGHFLEQGRRRGSFFDTPLIKLTEGIDQLGVKSPEEREAFLNDLDQLTDDFPEDFFKLKVLPELLKSVEFGGGGPKAFGVVMKISGKLSNEDFDLRVTPVIIRLFGNPDRAIRVCLLDNLPLMIDRFSPKVVNDKIFPQIVTGFTDLAPVVREQTLKSVLTIIPKLSDRTINGELLKYLAKTANDEQPGIRTNTTICLGKIAKHLGNSSRAKVLIAAFTRSLRDPFVHARNAALMALAATSEYFSEEDCAGRILPSVCPLLIDKEKVIRDQANKTIDVYLHKIRKAAANMPDTVLPPPNAIENTGPRMSSPQPNGSSTASWAGWAISSFTNKLSAAAGEIQPSATPTTSVPERLETKKTALVPPVSSTSEVRRQDVTSQSSTPQPQLSSSRTLSAGESFFVDPEPPFEDDMNAWGDMDDGSGADDGGTNVPVISTTAGPKRSTAPVPAPFDESEPDFAGWLAAQAQKKGGGLGGAKPLPKVAKPAPKKIDLRPKAQDNEDDDGWGEAW